MRGKQEAPGCGQGSRGLSRGRKKMLKVLKVIIFFSPLVSKTRERGRC